VFIIVISISYLSSSLLIPNIRIIAWNFDGSNFVGYVDKDEDMKVLRFENGDIVLNVESYFID
jgi:hypothetical protein